MLVHWPEENSLSVVQDVKVDRCPANKGDDCIVQAGSKMYRGKVMAVGKFIMPITVIDSVLTAFNLTFVFKLY